MDGVQKEFVREHKKFCWLRSQSIWNGEQIRQIYPKNELIGHEMLFEELFYLWDEKNAERALLYIREVYPETTLDDMRAVYSANADFIASIYG